MRISGPVLLLCLLAQCTQVPELDERLSPDLKNARFPTLIPLDSALGPPVSPADEAHRLEEELIARRDRLRNRAQAQQAPVVDDAARDRLQQATAG